MLVVAGDTEVALAFQLAGLPLAWRGALNITEEASSEVGIFAQRASGHLYRL